MVFGFLGVGTGSGASCLQFDCFPISVFWEEHGDGNRIIWRHVEWCNGMVGKLDT